MERTETIGSGPPFPPGSEGDQVVAFRVPWTHYDALCRVRADSAGPRMAYLDGVLEIMSPGRRHEFEKKLLARLVETFGEETGLSLNGYGSETFRVKAKKAGVEPDECYCVGKAKKLPDFAIEVVETSGGIDKLEVYRRLGIAEVWFLIKGTIYVYHLSGRRYRHTARSTALPRIDLDEIAAIVASTDESHQTEAVRAYRRSLRRRA